MCRFETLWLGTATRCGCNPKVWVSGECSADCEPGGGGGGGRGGISCQNEPSPQGQFHRQFCTSPKLKAKRFLRFFTIKRLSIISNGHTSCSARRRYRPASLCPTLSCRPLNGPARACAAEGRRAPARTRTPGTRVNPRVGRELKPCALLLRFS